MAKSKKGFSGWKPPSYDKVKEQAERRNNTYDNWLQDVKFFTPTQGENVIRILPPTFDEDSEFIGLRVYLHRDIGPDNKAFLCLKQNPSSPHDECPICDEYTRLGRKATADDKKALLPSEAMVYYLIDRENEKEGPMVWRTSMNNNSEIMSHALNRKTKAVLNIVDPDEGYDVSFLRTGKTFTNTRYRGFQVERDSSPLADSDKRYNEWMDHITEHPLTDALVFYEPDYIEKVFVGKAADPDDDDDEPEERPRRRARDYDEEEDKPLTRRRAARNEEDEDEKPRSRRSKDDDEDDEAPRSRQRTRSAEPDDDEDEPPKRSRSRGADEDADERPSRRRRAEPDDDDDAEPPKRTRSRLSQELDDEIPSEGRRRTARNDADEDDEDEKPRSRRSKTEDDDDDTPPPRRTRRAAADDDDDEDEGEVTTSRRQAVRERVNRGR